MEGRKNIISTGSRFSESTYRPKYRIMDLRLFYSHLFWNKIDLSGHHRKVCSSFQPGALLRDWFYILLHAKYVIILTSDESQWAPRKCIIQNKNSTDIRIFIFSGLKALLSYVQWVYDGLKAHFEPIFDDFSCFSHQKVERYANLSFYQLENTNGGSKIQKT